MLIYQLIGLFRSLGQNGICLGFGLRDNRFLVADDLLVLFDLIWNPKPQFHQKFFQFFLIYLYFRIGQRRKFAAVNIFFNLTN